MILALPRKVKPESQNMVDMKEAYNLWDTLSTLYYELEQLKTWENFAHDSDLKVILKAIKSTNKKNTEQIIALHRHYNIKGPSPNRRSMSSPTNPESMNDEQIARTIFFFLQEQVENYLQAVRTSMTNDKVRLLLINQGKKTIELSDGLVKYLKAKGWINTPPLYYDLPKNLTEKLTTAEAFHLWDHLSYRYDTAKQTEIFKTFAFDGDLKLVLNQGSKMLSDVIGLLEKELSYFGIPLPNKPSEITVQPNDTELLDDDHMFRILLMGMQAALTIHAVALKQCTFNDRIRSIFKKILYNELDYENSMVKFGKTKGWINWVPSYRET